MGIMAGICTSPSSSPYPIEKIGNSSYPYPFNAGILRQNREGFGQYPWGRVYLPSLPVVHTKHILPKKKLIVYRNLIVRKHILCIET